MFKKICEEPYRLFFPLGVIAGIFGVSHWIFYALKIQGDYSGAFHSSIQTQLYVSFFICGFLMTAGPRFAGAPSATLTEVTLFFSLFSLVGICVALHQWSTADGLYIALLIMLGRFLFQRMLKRGSYKPPAEFVWIPMGILCGICGAMLSIAARQGWLPAEVLVTGKAMKEQGFILAVVMGVGGFLGPRLMGFPGLLKPSELRSMAEAQKKRRQRMIIHFMAGLALWVSFCIEGSDRLVLAYGLRAVIVTAELLWTTSVYRFPVAKELFARLLWLSLWMFILGYWGAVLFPLRRKEMLHIVFIGGFSLLIFAVATMVVLNHAGEAEKLKKPLGVLVIAGSGVLFALVPRLIAAFFPEQYFGWLAVASALWLVAGFCWLGFVIPRLMQRRNSDSDPC